MTLIKYGKVMKKAKIMNRYNHVTHLTQYTIWKSDKIRGKHHSQESQGVSPISTGDFKAAKNRQDSIILKANMKHK